MIMSSKDAFNGVFAWLKNFKKKRILRKQKKKTAYFEKLWDDKLRGRKQENE